MKQRDTTNIKSFELWIYFCGWTGGVFYAIYHVYLRTSEYFEDYDDVYGDFSPGWGWIGGKRDDADPEWKVWIPLIYKIIPWVCAHIIGGQIIKYSFGCRMTLCCWYVVVSFTLLFPALGTRSTTLLLMQPLFSCLLVLMGSKSLLWTFHLSCIAMMNVMKNTDSFWSRLLRINEDEFILLMVVLAWVQLKSICFSVECIDKRQRNERSEGFLKETLLIFAYCLYLPTFFLGQLILFPEFVDGINKPFEDWNLRRLAKLVFNLCRYFFWILFTEFSLHFVYFNILQFHPELIRDFNSWALYGFGYCMGQFFSNKYVVVYGFSSAIAGAENIADLQTPKCIGRIHLYSDMWKYFDRGLHKFLVRYIYLPVAGATSSLRRIFASFLCFLFIYVWHGTHLFVFTWSMLNFLGLTIETFARRIGSSKIYVETERKIIGPRNARRFHCALASPLLAMSAISNFYFFGGQEIGNIFMQRIFNDSWKSIFTLLSVLYCCCQISTELKNREIMRLQSKKID